MDAGHGLTVEQSIAKGVIGDEVFESFPFPIVTISKQPGAPKTSLHIVKLHIKESQLFLPVFTSYEWAIEYINKSRRKNDMAIARLSGKELLELARNTPVFEGGLIVNFNINNHQCLAQTVVITKEEATVISTENALRAGNSES